MKIQPVDTEPPSRLLKSRLRRLFDRPFSTVLKPTEKPPLVDHREDFDPNSLSLRNMVRSYMEDTNDKPPRGRTTCNCFHRAGNASSEDEFDAPPSELSSTSIELLKSYVPCSTAAELDVLANVTVAVEKLKNLQQRKSELRKLVAVELSSIVYNSSVCKSKWNESTSIPAGEYEYIEVIVGGERVVVDIDFRSEFEIARSTAEYAALLQSLPLIFVGSAGRLDLIIGLMSGAAKQSLKKKGMMCPPWRKIEYMRAKWLSSHSNKTDPTTDDQPPQRSPQFDLVFRERSDFKSPDKMHLFDHGSRRCTGLAFLLKEKN